MSDCVRLRIHSILMLSLWTLVIGGSIAHAENKVPADPPGDDPSLILIEGTKTRWGFDGTVQTQQFNLLSVSVKNTSELPWEGTLELRQSIGSNLPRGLILRQQLLLSPGESRWIQFVPFVSDNLDNWTLVWGPGDIGRHDLNTAPTGPKATVLIYDSDAVTKFASELPRMSADLFPQSSSSLSGLRGIILAHSPFWTGARVRTMLEWLHRGGRVYLVQDANGRFPQFPESLAVLNQAADEFRVGAGVVRRIPIPVDELTGDFARREIYHDDQPANVRNRLAADAVGFQFGSTILGWSRDEFAFNELRDLAIFQRPWLLIYLVIAAYLITLYPGCYRLGREQSQVRWFYLTFFGASLLFSLVFIGLGQVGGQERSRLRSTGVAHAVSPGVYQVSRWLTACVRDEGTYTLEVPGIGPSVTAAEAVDETHPPQGYFDVDLGQTTFEMAPAATQSFRERTRVVSKVTPPQLLSIEESAGRVIDIKIDPGVDFVSETHAAWLVQDQTIFSLDIRKATWTLDRTKPFQTITGLLSVPRDSPWTLRVGSNWWLPWSSEESKSKDEQFVLKRLEPLLVAESFGLTNYADPRYARAAPGMIRILAHRSVPEDFRYGRAQFPDQRGSLMFVFEIPDPKSR